MADQKPHLGEEMKNQIQKEVAEKEKIAENLNFPLRKVVHGIEYFLLSILVLISLSYTGIKGYKAYGISFISCVIYSLLDEYHQTFILGRTGQLLDVGIDSIGILLALVGIYLINKKKKIVNIS